MTKNTLCILLLAMLLSSCGGGDSGSGTPPTIHDVGIFRTASPDSRTDNIIQGRMYYIAMHASDPDLDMHTVHIKSYFGDATSPSWQNTWILDRQQEASVIYWSEYYPEYGPTGNWRTSFVVTDYAGNQSNIYWIYTTSRRSKDFDKSKYEEHETDSLSMNELEFFISTDKNDFFARDH
jgi:hypothetical protein